jgi:sugar/nucleoside kinase (ribokinase family)
MMNAKLPSTSVYGTGLIALDIVMGRDRLESPRDSAGGTCGNVLAILSFLGWNAYPIARLNGDAASMRVKADLRRWGVHLDHAELTPTSPTPVIIQEIIARENGTPTHRFAWSCPICGRAWPKYLPVTAASVRGLEFPARQPTVFFTDRLSRAAVNLAKTMAALGALIVFEPSGRGEENLWSEMLQVTHILKYSQDRMSSLDAAAYRTSSVRLEIQTRGPQGLRYRSRLRRVRTHDWVELDAVNVSRLSDTCGAGDWCTAGLLHRIAGPGRPGLMAASSADIVAALNWGQSLAAWNCGFEGARGGMYEVGRRGFDQQISQIEAGANIVTSRRSVHRRRGRIAAEFCPSCT